MYSDDKSGYNAFRAIRKELYELFSSMQFANIHRQMQTAREKAITSTARLVKNVKKSSMR